MEETVYLPPIQNIYSPLKQTTMAKKVLFFAFLMAAVSFWATFCSNDEEVVYSCNSSVDEWTKEHLSEIRKMTRSEWKQLPSDVNIAAYRAFTPEQKFSFWMDKFEEVKNLPWTAEEQAHIAKAEAFIKTRSHLFSDEAPSEESLNEVELFFYRWMKEAETSLKWDKSVVYAIAASGNSMTISRRSFRSSSTDSVAVQADLIEPSPDVTITPGINRPGGGTGKTKNCNCSTSSIFTCLGENADCRNVDCDDSVRGCGFIWLAQCDGLCQGI